MSKLKRTVLYQAHLDAGATMVDFGGWDMPIQYPDGIVAEHLYCRSHCGIFDEQRACARRESGAVLHHPG